MRGTHELRRSGHFVIALPAAPATIFSALRSFTRQILAFVISPVTTRLNAPINATTIRRAIAAIVVAAALTMTMASALTARADTIVLKNGRRIVGGSVTRENGKVSCETSAGIVSVPESLVERIEKDATGIATASQANPAALDLGIGAPQADGAGLTDSGSVVQDGVLDRVALARLDDAASNGSAAAIARAVSAETAASRFELQRHDLDAALEHAEHALSLAPAQPMPLLLNVAYLHLRRNEFGAALDDLERAKRGTPDSAPASVPPSVDIARLTGWADYGLNRLPDAVAEWKHAQQLSPDPGVARALDKAQRDLDVESKFREGESAHFNLRYFGGAEPELARGILVTLEDAFQAISSELRYTPPEPIAVILYTREQFRDITRTPGWVGALNDGRIRVPVQGLTMVTPQLASILKHELTHSFVSQITHARSPIWLQEGVAQWMEGKRSGDAAAGLLALYDAHEDPSLANLEGSWLNLPGDYASIAYAWSLAAIEAVETSNPGDIERLLNAVAEEPTPEAAVRSALHMSYADLNAATAEFLRKNYSH